MFISWLWRGHARSLKSACINFNIFNKINKCIVYFQVNRHLTKKNCVSFSSKKTSTTIYLKRLSWWPVVTASAIWYSTLHLPFEKPRPSPSLQMKRTWPSLAASEWEISLHSLSLFLWLRMRNAILILC